MTFNFSCDSKLHITPGDMNPSGDMPNRQKLKIFIGYFYFSRRYAYICIYDIIGGSSNSEATFEYPFNVLSSAKNFNLGNNF
jgi:hypothetical protein